MRFRDGIRCSSTVAAFLAILLLTAVSPASANQNSALWKALKGGGHIAFMRHALAPGTGDPANFNLADCATQRNLDDRGRSQAERIGDRFRMAGIETARVYSSQWCRCLDTATLLDIGPVNSLSALNSIYQRPQERAPRLAALEDFLATRDVDETLVLVTHHTLIGAYTGIYPASGEIVVARSLKDGTVEPIGRIATD